MARKLIDQDEVARMLGVTTEEVASLRDRKKLFPYRDGDQWKFKLEDIERYREEMQAEKAEAPADDGAAWSVGDDLDDLDLQVGGDDLDSILLSEVEMGNSSTEGASTIIGKVEEGPAPEFDLPPAGAANAPPAAPPSDSGIALAIDSPSKGDSNISLASDSGPKSDSAVALGGGSSGFSIAGDSGLALASSDVKLVPGGTDIGKKSGGSSDKLFGSDALKLSDDELSLIDAGSSVQQKPKPSGSSIKLGDEELEVVLGGSKAGSDVTQSPTDSGIQLISPSDSGLSLDQPLALGSSARRLLDIPGEEGAEEGVAAEAPAEELKTDEDFLLTAMDDTGGEESSDSGSQVIALDTDDELSSGMFAPVGGGAGLLEEEPVGAEGASPVTLAPSPSFTASPALMGGTVPMVPAEAPYSTANVVVLSICAVLLLLCGTMTFDLMRNMWSWDGPYAVNSSILESIGKTVGWLEK